jgi:hypothetical protein
MICISSFVLVLCVALLVPALLGFIHISPEGLALFGVFGVASSFLLFRSTMDFRRNVKWVFEVDTRQISLFRIDNERRELMGAVEIHEIYALTYRDGGEDGSPYLDIEFRDSTVEKLSSAGLLDRPALLEFINYWLAEHSDIPIRNLNAA